MAEAAAKEPSMEDILSSIRKIIADEGDVDGEPAAATDAASVRIDESQEEAAPSPASDATETAEALTPPVEAPKPPEANLHVPVEREPEPEVSLEPEESNASLASIAASLQASSPEADEVVFDEPEVVQEAEPEQEEVSHVEMADATPPPQPDFMSAAETEAATSPEMKREEEAFRGALMSPSADNAVSGSFDRLKRSAMDDIEAKTEAILRPMLREWLDENLPTLVERMVREEIERVARG